MVKDAEIERLLHSVLVSFVCIHYTVFSPMLRGIVICQALESLSGMKCSATINGDLGVVL